MDGRDFDTESFNCHSDARQLPHYANRYMMFNPSRTQAAVFNAVSVCHFLDLCSL